MTTAPDDPREALLGAAAAAVLESPATLPVATRKALADGDLGSMPEEGRTYLTKVEGPSYRTTDLEVSALARVIGEEAVFEATIAVALGAAQRQIEAALALFEQRP